MLVSLEEPRPSVVLAQVENVWLPGEPIFLDGKIEGGGEDLSLTIHLRVGTAGGLPELDVLPDEIRSHGDRSNVTEELADLFPVVERLPETLDLSLAVVGLERVEKIGDREPFGTRPRERSNAAPVIGHLALPVAKHLPRRRFTV